MGKRKAKADQRAALHSRGFSALPHVVQDSEAYRHLSLYGRAVLMEVVREFNGYNNGKIGLCFDAICARLKTTNRRSISRAFVELFDHGLVDVGAPADHRHHKAREYRLTFVSTTANNHHVQATGEYLKWTPPERQKHGDDVLPKPAVHGDDVLPRRTAHGDDVSLKITAARGKTPRRYGDDVSLHIVSHVPAASEGGRAGRPAPPATGDGSRICETCGAGFKLVKPDRAHPRRFCSETCRKAAERKRAKQRAVA